MTRILTAITFALCLGVSSVSAASLSPEQKTEVEDIIRSYLLEHPELLREMSDKLQEKERLAEDAARTEALSKHAGAIYKAGDDPVVGNPQGDVTIVEFFDYNCSWCKRSLSEVVSLAESDKNLRIIMKEFPIFGENSDYAARAALAANRQGKYWELHQALFKHEGPVNPEVTDQLAETVGVDVAKMKADMEDPQIVAKIKSNQELAQSLVINGTPAFVVDDKVVPGFIQLNDLTAMIAEVRGGGGCKLC